VSTASTRAYETIRGLILEGRYPAGARLKEEELTELCGASRTPVRDALRRLAAEGMVNFAPHQGAQVAAIGDEELAEIYALRAMIEGHAAGRAARRISAADLARLDELATEMEDLVRQGGDTLPARFAEANAEFHRTILAAAVSPRLSVMASLVVEIPLMLRTFVRYSGDEVERSLRHHRELIAAFRARDVDWARSVMRSHIFAASRVVGRSEPQ
jgi:DNA-binding GntR family transcriptional regulator